MKIHDVIITPLKVISDNRGKVMHMLRRDDEIFKNLAKSIFPLFSLTKLKLGIYTRINSKLFMR